MARHLFLFALALQATLIYANVIEDKHNFPIKDESKEPKDTDIIDMIPVNNHGKLTEEELKDIKEVAKLISLAIHEEMTHFLTQVLKYSDDEIKREKRSTETDDSIVIKLLKHIKSNNEFQNTAIEKIMAAQQLAEQSGLSFTPNSDIFTELAIASSKQIEELSSILNAAYEADKKTSELKFVPINNEPTETTENNSYYKYHVEIPEVEVTEQLTTPPPHEYVPDVVEFKTQIPENFINIEPQKIRFHYNVPCETQIPPPPQYLPPASPIPAPETINEHVSFSYMPDFIEQLLFSPLEFSEPIPLEEPATIFIPIADIILPLDEPVEPEPELIGEELEETVKSKVIVSKGDEPGTATVNHVMTYTVSEKSHFKKPEVEVPEMLQFFFML